MPAWGSSHDDETIWSMVSFLRLLPTLTAEQYKKMVAEAPRDDDLNMKMDHKAAPSGQPGA